MLVLLEISVVSLLSSFSNFLIYIICLLYLSNISVLRYVYIYFKETGSLHPHTAAAAATTTN